MILMQKTQHMRHQCGKLLPLRGDTSKLLYAKGITPLQKRLLQNMHFTGAGISGVQSTRTHIGRCMFGAQTTYGLPFFLTISPNERFSSLVLRLSRYRLNDPLLLHHKGLDAAALRSYAGQDRPSLRAPDAHDKDIGQASIDIPMYDIRRAMLAKDCVSIVQCFHTYLRFALGRLLGIRMCPMCPRCNANDAEFPCQDRFGSNASPMGGILGRADAIGGVVEHQGQGTPHYHACVYVQRLHQHKTLQDIMDIIKKDLTQVNALKEFQSWACREEHFLLKMHDAEIEDIERDWPAYKAVADNKLCVLPAFLASDPSTSTWIQLVSSSGAGELSEGAPSIDEQGLSAPFEARLLREQASSDAVVWRKKYMKHVQYVFSRVQHHMHKINPATGKRCPLTACKKAGTKKDLCKHDFPKLAQMSNVVRLVCKGVARMHELPLRGRRAALGSFLGKRDAPWHTGTAPALAAFFQSNTHIIVNDRLAISAETHDDRCEYKCVASSINSDIVADTQRAQTLMTGYITGYFAKIQPVGKYELERCTQTMGFLRPKLESNNAAVQMMQTTSRMLSDLEGRGTMHTAPETCNLNANLDDKDALAAEFVRTYRNVVFPGGAFIYRQEVEHKSRLQLAQPGLDDSESKHRISTRLPPCRRLSPKNPKLPMPLVDIYGYRGRDPRVHYLSPYEFVSLWTAELLLPPCSSNNQDRTRWLSGGAAYYEDHRKDVQGSTLQPGVHYEVVPECASNNLILLPNDPELRTFRHQWILSRHDRPMVPCPSKTPLPGRNTKTDEAARFLSVYLRPWVLSHRQTSHHVLHLSELHCAPAFCRRSEGKQSRWTPQQATSWFDSWGWYLGGHVVSEHSRRCIQNMLAMCCARGCKPREHENEGDANADLHTDVSIDRNINLVHDILRRSFEETFLAMVLCVWVISLSISLKQRAVGSALRRPVAKSP